MPNQKEDVDTVDVWKEKVQQDINDLKQGQSQLKTDVDNLKLNDVKQDGKIISLQDTLRAIQDDTNWIRRKITGAFITALITAVVAGIVGIAIANIF
ncbi:hemolysin XhlA family protein [Virgibacillus oceani]